MKITPALAYEKLRQDAQSQNKIILHKDGKFYHVYEWSAWLLKTLVCTAHGRRGHRYARFLVCFRTMHLSTSVRGCFLFPNFLPSARSTET